MHQTDSNDDRSTPLAAPDAGLLERNLAALAADDPSVVEAIRAADSSAVLLGDAADGSWWVEFDRARLCSRHRPGEEANRLVESFDPLENAVAVVLGFGSGHAVRALARALRGTGSVIVFEPEPALVRAVFERVDCTTWLAPARVVLIFDESDRGAVTRRVGGLQTQLVVGARIIEPPANRRRLGERGRAFVQLFTDILLGARTQMATSLTRSAGTVRNELLNLDHYALGPGCEDLRDAARGGLGIVVSAGPSLRRNVHLLADPEVRNRCVIVAVQTALRPLLDAGVRPHFVVALDYHHISRRFYEGLRPREVEGVELVIEPQAHPVIADSFPGRVRCCAATALDGVLGPLARPMGAVPYGTTVAHLAYHLVRFMGCDPVALIGQDLGFTDGLYYARGTKIDDVWAPELNPFNTIEMMEWQRIVRHKGQLRRLEDVHGKSILTDHQMHAYLQRFEQHFAEDATRGLTTIDATEGGVRKAHTEIHSLADVLARHAVDPLPKRAAAAPPDDVPGRREAVLERVARLRAQVGRFAALSRETAGHLEELRAHQRDATRSARVFERIEASRAEVETLRDAFALIDRAGQLGVFRRYVADRRLELVPEDDPFARQLAQIDRDLDNVRWLADAADDSERVLAEAESVVRTGALPPDSLVEERGDLLRDAMSRIDGGDVDAPSRVVALVPIDPRRGGDGTPRSLGSRIADRSVIQRTLERLGTSTRLERIVLLCPDDWDVDERVDPTRIGLPVSVWRCGDSVFGPRHRAIRVARAFAETCWRGGIHGMTVFDEVLAPGAMLDVMEKESIDAAVLCGPDWPFVEVLGTGGVDELVDRHLAAPRRRPFVFTQAPPGLGACVVSRTIMREFAFPSRLATIGAYLGYRPDRPIADPIVRDVNVPIDPSVRSAIVRATFDAPRLRLRMRRALEPILNDVAEEHGSRIPASDVLDAIEHVRRAGLPNYVPRHLIVELCTGRRSSGVCSPHRFGSIQREPMSLRRFERLADLLAESRDSVITFGGAGDPLHHPDFERFVEIARNAGATATHVRTELLGGPGTVERILASGVDVVSIELNADTPEAYRRVNGPDRFEEVRTAMGQLIDGRRILEGEGLTAFALPWVVPRLMRRIETYDEVEPFFERWQTYLGTAVIEGPPPHDSTDDRPADPLASARAPERVMVARAFRRMVILSDGRVPLSELDLQGESCVGSMDQASLLDLWRAVVDARRRALRDEGPSAFALRSRQP